MPCSTTQPKVVINVRSRLDRFRVDELKLSERVSSEALKSGEWQASTDYGGQITSEERRSAGKAPLTEIAWSVSDPNGLTVTWVDTCDAYSVTPRKIVTSVILTIVHKSQIDVDAGSRIIDLFDRRVKNKQRRASGWDALKDYHSNHFSAIEKLASAAS